jgi:hypothetical protein
VLWLGRHPLEVHDELRLLLAWPEEQEAAAEAARVREANERDREQAEGLAMTAATLGVNPDKMWDVAIERRRAGLEEYRRMQEAGEV